MAKIANFLMICAQHLERVTQSISKTHRLHLHPPHLESGLEGMHRETFATSIGTLVNAIVGSTAHLNTKRTPTHNLGVPTLRAE